MAAKGVCTSTVEKKKKTSAQFTFNARPALPARRGDSPPLRPMEIKTGQASAVRKFATVNSWDVRTSKSHSVMKPR